MKCKVASLKLNCGCCDETTLVCDLDEGHIGMHHFFTVVSNHTYEIVWTDVTEVKRASKAPVVSRETEPGVSPDFHW